jgi:hypothetical protein
MIPRGKYPGKPVDDPPTDEAEHFIRCRLAAVGSTAAISGAYLSTRDRYPTRRAIRHGMDR